ncbi:MAG: YdbL family protein [bacterium]|nr:YdbL family protein [bacterium]
MNRIFFIIIISIIFYGLTGCSSAPSCLRVAPPTINLTGQKTAVERQIVGDYKELEKDAWAVSSVKSTVQKSKGGDATAGGDPELFKALKVREFHKEKIREYKTEGALGETNTGYVKYMKVSKYEKNGVEKDELLTVIKNENMARKKIFERVLFVTKKKEPLEGDINAYGRLFAEEQRNIAEKSDWVQKKSGAWGRK